MNAMLLFAVWLVPLALLPLSSRERGRFWPAAAAAPAVIAAALLPAGTVIDADWLLMGAQLGLTASDRMFLGAAGVLWVAASLYMAIYMRRDPHAARFRAFFLLAMSGNFGLIVGQDLMSFYLGFTVMGLAAYGLIVHDGNAAVRRAGRVYLTMTLVGEFALFAAFLMLYQRTGSLIPSQALAGAGPVEVGLLLLAFGIKAGMIGVHMWLPLAHPAAPIPASAVLSGAMIKTALIGWMRYLPLGHEVLPELGVLLILLGLTSALLPIPLGLLQRDPKVVLAYSSISKMGIAITALGFVALAPSVGTAVFTAVSFYAAHHGLAKGALFLGVGIIRTLNTRWLWLLALPALVLIGIPFTSGAMAKDLLKSAIAGAPTIWVNVLIWGLTLAALGSTGLMGRFLYLMRQDADSSKPAYGPLVLPWLGVLLLSLGLGWGSGPSTMTLANVWPVLAAGTIAGFFTVRQPAALSWWVGRIPAGDVLAPLLTVSHWVQGVCAHVGAWANFKTRHLRAWDAPVSIDAIREVAQGVESALGGRAVAALLWLCIGGLTLLFVFIP